MDEYWNGYLLYCCCQHSDDWFCQLFCCWFFVENAESHRIWLKTEFLWLKKKKFQSYIASSHNVTNDTIFHMSMYMCKCQRKSFMPSLSLSFSCTRSIWFELIIFFNKIFRIYSPFIQVHALHMHWIPVDHIFSINNKCCMKRTEKKSRLLHPSARPFHSRWMKISFDAEHTF